MSAFDASQLPVVASVAVSQTNPPFENAPGLLQPAGTAVRGPRRPPSLSAPSARELGLLGVSTDTTGRRSSAFGGVSTLLQPLVAADDEVRSPLPTSGDDGPMFYQGPLPPVPAVAADATPSTTASGDSSATAVSTADGLPRSPPPRVLPMLFVGGGMLTSVVPESTSRLALPVLASPSNGTGKGDTSEESDVALLQLTKSSSSFSGVCSRCWRSVFRVHSLAIMNEYAIRFGTHIAILSIFETLFFWFIVGPTEDNALFSVLDTYMNSTLATCPSWNATERAVLSALLGLLVNKTAVDAQGVAAAASRATYNGVLRRNSWLYVLGLFALLAFLVGQTLWRRKTLAWGVIAAENVFMIVLLGLYEYMFFWTVR